MNQRNRTRIGLGLLIALTGCPGPDPHRATEASGPYNDMTDASFWSTFDLSSVDGGATGFEGAAFDKRYVYFVPNDNSGTGAYDGIVAQYDTQSGMGFTGSSFSIFDMSSIDPNAKGFVGAAFDGKYVYFAPIANGTVMQFDTTKKLDDSMAWSKFDTTTIGAAGYYGAIFAKPYIYFVPYYDGTAYDGVVVRYDTTQAFNLVASWSKFNIAAVNPNAVGFVGAVFDGKFLYFVPHYAGMGFHGNVARYDTQATGGFTDIGSWSTFDTAANVDPRAKGYWGAVFDGQFVYFVPFSIAKGTMDGVVARFDTRGGSFSGRDSWATFDTATVNSNAKGFAGGAFDGRYVYFVPNSSAQDEYHGTIARYDTHATFTDGASWSTFDTTHVDPNAKGFVGAAFDGEYLYLVPNKNGSSPDGVIARFNARTSPSLPSGYTGSFF